MTDFVFARDYGAQIQAARRAAEKLDVLIDNGLRRFLHAARRVLAVFHREWKPRSLADLNLCTAEQRLIFQALEQGATGGNYVRTEGPRVQDRRS